MYKWQEAFLSGNFSSNNEIAVKVFGKSMPPEPFLRDNHNYPFHSIDTLRAWVNWDCKLLPASNVSMDRIRLPGKTIKDGDTVFVKTEYIRR